MRFLIWLSPALMAAGFRPASSLDPTNMAAGNRRAVALQCLKAKTLSNSTAGTFSKLRMTQLYLKLVTMPENADGVNTVSLLWVGSYEIRMFEAAPANAVDMPLFWLEVFDHDSQSGVDSCSCADFDAAMPAFEALVAQAIGYDELAKQRVGESECE